MLSFKTMELIRNSGHVSSQFVDLVLRVAEGILMREAFVQSAGTRLNATVNTFAQFFTGGSGQGGVEGLHGGNGRSEGYPTATLT